MTVSRITRTGFAALTLLLATVTTVGAAQAQHTDTRAAADVAAHAAVVTPSADSGVTDTPWGPSDTPWGP
ncbi:hypothetical protein AB0N07_43415 [Streptomyces sp. NPDC051172]|uniref:hypothetical protein n=1 Tax=Streptomyces sp. NPDC051172 TaxID=3155796 RepID=UPI00342B4737